MSTKDQKNSGKKPRNFTSSHRQTEVPQKPWTVIGVIG